MSNPPIDWEKTCLTIYCRSKRDGKGPLTPQKFQLLPIPRGMLSPTEYKTTYNIHAPPGSPGAGPGGIRLALVHVHINSLPQEARYIPLQYPPNPKIYIPQWPWIFATVMRMQNHNAELAKFRMDLLIPYVEALIKESKVDVLAFKAPIGLGGREGWVLYDLEKWQGIFGHCIEV
jgi:hypothetical protein